MDSASSVFRLTKSQRTFPYTNWLSHTQHNMSPPLSLTVQGARSWKVPKLFGSFSGVKILSVSYGRRNVKTIKLHNHVAFRCLENKSQEQLVKTIEWPFRKRFRYVRETGPRSLVSRTLLPSPSEILFLTSYILSHFHQ